MLCIALAVGGVYVRRSYTVYPNVSVNGVDVGGMTLREAELALDAAPAFHQDPDASVTVELPGETSVTLTASEAGLSSGADSAAALAYDYGRGGSLLGNLLSYVRCSVSGVSLRSVTERTLDEQTIRGAIHDAVIEAQNKLNESAYEISEDTLTLVKGVETVVMDEDAIYSMVENAFLQQDYTTLRYEPENGGKVQELDLQALYDQIHEEPVSARYDSATASVLDAEPGRDFDLEDALRRWNAAEIGDRIVIPIETVEPLVSAEELSAKLFADCLSQKSTTLGGSSSSRVNNITRAAESINGIVLNPGEEFSYNEALGERTAGNGYELAGAYANGQTVQEYGGGICQVSSTLYNAALYANLKITSRYCHYFSVNYVPAGLDATVSWPSPDFRFVNDRNYPIRIEAYTDMTAYTVVVKIWGTDEDGSYVEMTNESWQTEDGIGAVTYRWVYDENGELISKTEESRSQYHFHTEEEEEPTPTPTQAPTQAPAVTTPTPGTQAPTQAPTETPTETPVTETPVTQAPVTETPTEQPTLPPVVVVPDTPAPEPTLPVEPEPVVVP